MPDSRRILITGLSSHWGGRLAQQLERNTSIEAIVGVDTTDPRHELHRTEYVRVDTDDALLRRIVKAAAIDTVIDTRLIPDPLPTGVRHAHDVDVLGTRNVLGACSGTDSPVRKFVFKSSAHYYGADQNDPAFFSEDMVARRPARTAIEHDVVDAELAVSGFARDNPATTVTVLRFAGAVGTELRASHVGLLNLPVVPAILGFDPRCQFIHEDDVIAVLVHAVRHDLPGSYNAAADGVLALSEVASLLGKPLLPVLPPWGTVFAAMQLRRLGLRVPVEMLCDLRCGRGLDNRKLKATGYAYRYTTRETVQKLRAGQRLRPLLRSGSGSYRYEREVEEFLRWSPSVQGSEIGQAGAAAAPAADGRPAAGGRPVADGRPAMPPDSLDLLGEGELLDIIPSLETDALEQLSDHEAAHRARPRVLDALEHQLARRGAGRN